MASAPSPPPSPHLLPVLTLVALRGFYDEAEVAFALSHSLYWDTGLGDALAHVSFVGGGPSHRRPQWRARKGRTRVHHAALTGNTARLEWLLARGADPNVCDEQGRTPLMLAAGAGAPRALILALVAAGADLRAEDAIDRSSAAIYCIKGGAHTETLDALIDAGLDPSAPTLPNTPRWSLLHAAVTHNNASLLTHLLRRCAGADLTTVEAGLTCIQRASYKGHAEIVQTLLAHGADAKATVYDKFYDPLSLATAMDHADVIRILAPHVDVDRPLRFGYTALMRAAMSGSAKMVAALCDDARADMFVENKMGKTALDVAIDEGHVQCVRALCERGAVVLPVGASRGSCPHGRLFVAALRNKRGTEPAAGIVRALAEFGADVNSRVCDENGREESTPLLHECLHDARMPVIDALLDSGADVNQAGCWGWGGGGGGGWEEEAEGRGAREGRGGLEVITPLMAACLAERQDVLERLIRHGADVNARTTEWTAALIAYAQRFTAGLALLADAGATLEPRMIAALQTTTGGTGERHEEAVEEGQ
jgi:ankyrin repeat protein